MKHYKQIVFAIFVLILGLLTACGKQEKVEQPQNGISIVKYNEDAASKELNEYFG